MNEDRNAARREIRARMTDEGDVMNEDRREIRARMTDEERDVMNEDRRDRMTDEERDVINADQPLIVVDIEDNNIQYYDAGHIYIFKCTIERISFLKTKKINKK